MSSICFKTRESKAAHLRGSERAYFGRLLNHNALAILSMLYNPRMNNEMLQHLPNDCYCRHNNPFKDSFEVWFSVNDGNLILDGVEVSPFNISINTGILAGSDQIYLMAKIHECCELHGYFMQEDFPFFSNVIEKGLKHNIFRKNQGWEDVLELFKQATSPIVMSYSVCDSFPNELIIGIDENEYCELTQSKQFDLAFEELSKDDALRIEEERHLFEPAITAYDFVNKG